MPAVRKSKSAASTPPLKQSTLLFPSTKRSNSAQTVAKGKKPLRAVSDSTNSEQPKRRRSLVNSPSDSSESSSEDEKITSVKKRKVDERIIKADQLDPVEADVKREKLDQSDKKWSKQFSIAREKMGNLSPVHGTGLTKVNQILRVFDLSYEYGPCVGIPRLQRWERAEALGLNPPREIYDILTTEEGFTDDSVKECVFYGDV